ncbi:isochorismate synthase MenF [Mesobacillus maritimus]|uniref:isochorismate synthase n=1 Tax=Mesobacillus maritimus TaxID=1643336 RepID=UPI00384C293F
MVTIHDTELRQGIVTAIEKSKQLSQSIMVSEVQKIKGIDPLNFFAAGRNRFLGERFFWKDPSGDQVIVGIGVVKQVQSDQATGRFDRTEIEWKQLVKDAVTCGEQTKPGTGPAIFGGFAFDPLKKKTGLWSKFSESLFHIPKYMLSFIDGEFYFTTNVFCTQHDDGELFDKVYKDRQDLLGAVFQKQNFSYPSIVKMEEIKAEEWKKSVTSLVESFADSNLKKVVVARELRLQFENTVQVEKVLTHLLEEQKESFIFAFEVNGDCFIGASPERLVKKEETRVLTTCLAGSIARGSTLEEDRLLGQNLLEDQKNLVEHQYVVDMIKEAMEETCEKVTLPDEPQLMKTKYIQHLYTPVIGQSREGTSLLDIVNRLHPTPALGGVPKDQAVTKIREIEELDRGFYAAPIGWQDAQGNGEFAVAIRSALIQGKEASLFAGCGVVADSEAESEYIETSIKFRPMLTALGGKRK